MGREWRAMGREGGMFKISNAMGGGCSVVRACVWDWDIDGFNTDLSRWRRGRPCLTY